MHEKLPARPDIRVGRIMHKRGHFGTPRAGQRFAISSEQGRKRGGVQRFDELLVRAAIGGTREMRVHEGSDRFEVAGDRGISKPADATIGGVSDARIVDAALEPVALGNKPGVVNIARRLLELR